MNELNTNLNGAQQENAQLSADLRGKEQRIADTHRILDQKCRCESPA
ncbi:hypothetical protein Hsw_1991 [Hymenobacter swuensis DY53]|uniref:Uncharacterized protein n=1 Tax=Hymenobacter swuensis DY53 TaxID=1227739 RepID=W8F4Q3_9BACT|nr:hypothetical protein Hsw_1991 [Hymenobacter swuensis DY53]